MNKKITKKVFSLLLVFTMVFPNIAFADLQSQVTDLTITNRSSASGTDYSMEFNWTRPYQSGKSDSAAYLDSDKNGPHRATEYSFYYRNGTASESYDESKKVVMQDPVTDKTNVTTTSPLNYLFQPSYLEPGSIYSFYVDPTHKQNYPQTVNGVTTSYEDDANKTTTTIKETLFLTDIEVEASISGDQMTVTWDNPTYMGATIFSGYKIYYQKGGAELSEIPDNPSVTIGSDSTDLLSSEGKLTYTFTADNLEVGAVYAVKVEPMYNGVVVREMSTPKITINNTIYDIAFTEREYRVNDAYVSPALYIMQEGLDSIRLYWDDLSSSTFDITKLEIYSSKSENFDQSVLIGSLEGLSASRINYWLTDMPDSLTYYKFILYYEDGTVVNTMESNIVYFDPSTFEFSPYMPNIMEVEVDNEGTSPVLDIIWEAFIRNPYTQAEEDSLNDVVNKYVDKELDYKIWITDDVSNYNNTAFEEYYIKKIDATGLVESEYVVDEITNEKTLVYNDNFTSYYSYSSNGGAVLNTLEENKIYYIKIQAERHISGDESQIAYYAIYIPPSSSIITNPLYINNPPFKIKTDSTGVQEITETTITVEWSTQWYELYDETTKEWYSKVGVDDNGNIVFGDDTDNLSNSKIIYLDSDYLFGSNESESIYNIKEALISLGASSADANLLPARLMDISESNYELHTAPYLYMEEQGGYSTYFDLIKEDDALWTEVTGEANGKRKLVYTVTNKNAPDTGELEQNTSYIIYFRNFIIVDEEKIYSEHPTYATGTTLKDRGDLIVTPTSQIIEYVSSTYDTVTFRWKYTNNMSYTLAYSNLVTDYSSGGVTVDSATIEENKVVKTEDGVSYIYYTISNLFPETNYYAWLNATSGEITSDWSTAASGKTTELEIPLKPRGVGLISDDFLQAINAENNTSYVKDDPTNLIFEWTRTGKDTQDYGVTGITTVENDEYFGSVSYFSNYGVKFNDLKANYRYYFRIRTVLNAVRNGMSGDYFYSYQVELADNPRFKDSTTFLVPDQGLTADGVDILEVVSEWSTVYSFETGKSGDEYDGEIDPDQYPMPLDDFDVTYDETTDTLKYVFRSTGTDSSGNQNHYVDQRFITNLQQRGYFDFVVDVTDYNGIYPKTRIVEIPSSIANALMETKTSLTMSANNMEVTVLPDTFQSENMLNDDSTNITFEFNLNTEALNMVSGTSSYLSAPHTFEATVSSELQTKNVSMFNNNLEVTLTPNNQYESVDKNINAYRLQNEAWQVLTSEKQSDGDYKVTTKLPGTYTLIAKDVEQSEVIDDSYYNLNNELLITDLTYYVPEYEITTTQFNNIVYAIATDKKSVAMNETLTEEAYNSLGKAGLLVSGSYVTNDKGIASLVRLYELKTGSQIKPSTDPISNIGTASAETLIPIQKAYEIEMFSYFRNFSENMTFGEFVHYINAVISDS